MTADDTEVLGCGMDRATPNLPSRDFASTVDFYGRLGFIETFRDSGWLILVRGSLQIEWFPWPRLDPGRNIASCCLRVAEVDALHVEWAAAGIPTDPTGIPRITQPASHGGLREFSVVDRDGNLLRVIGPDPGAHVHNRPGGND